MYFELNQAKAQVKEGTDQSVDNSQDTKVVDENK